MEDMLLDFNETIEELEFKVKQENATLETDYATLGLAFEHYVDLLFYSSRDPYTIKQESFYQVDDLINTVCDFLTTNGIEHNYFNVKLERNVNGFIHRQERLKDLVGTLASGITKLLTTIFKRISQIAIYMYRKLRKTFSGYSKKMLQQAKAMNGEAGKILDILTDTDKDTCYQIYGRKGAKYKDLKLLGHQDLMEGGHKVLHVFLKDMINLETPITFLDSIKNMFNSTAVSSIIIENTESLNNKIREAAAKKLKTSGPKQLRLEKITELVSAKKNISKENIIVSLFGVKKLYYWQWTNESYTHPPKGKINNINLRDLLEEPELDREQSAQDLFILSNYSEGLIKHLDKIEGKIVSVTNKMKNRANDDVKKVTDQLKKYVTKDSQPQLQKNVKAYIQCYSSLGVMSTSRQLSVMYDNIYWLYSTLKDVLNTTHAIMEKALAADKDGGKSLNS